MSERVITGRFQPLAVEIQAELAAQHGLDTLLFCPNAWALRHRFVNTETGETVRARCGSWSCLYCGPRKVDMWRQLVKAAEPTLFITLTQVGKTLKEAARVLTTVLQYLRRGSKGRGQNHVGARPAYPIEVFAILEEHSDFENVGFHWHLLVKGVEFLPNQVVSDALRSATGGRSYITKTERVRNNRAVGYVTKYLMKEIARERRGMIEEQVVKPLVSVNDEGRLVQEEVMVTVERLCKAHRIRYSKHFFPEKTVDLRRRVFGEREKDAGEKQGGIAPSPALTPDSDYLEASQRESVTYPDTVSDEHLSCTQDACQHKDADDGKKVGEMSGERAQSDVKRSPWTLYEAEPAIDDTQVWERRRMATLAGNMLSSEEEESSLEAYRRRRWMALIEALVALREGRRLYSRRVVSIWSYQRGQLRVAS